MLGQNLILYSLFSKLTDKNKVKPMYKKERSAVTSLSVIMAFRMLGLFMILPVFSIQAEKLAGATPFLIGLALGVYGLTQAIFQMPFGTLSDHIGRKPVMFFGLLLFIAGSMVCAYAHSMHLMILGRAIQGAGAIGSTILATIADLTRDENRSKAMAMVGFTIGFAFTIALITGPIINNWLHLSGIFWVTAGLGAVGILLLITVPKPPQLLFHQETKKATQFKSIIKNRELLRLDLGIFCLHAILTAMFIAVPILLTHLIQLSEIKQVLLYLVVLIAAFFIAVPFIIISEKKRKLKMTFVMAILSILFTELLLIVFQNHSILIGFTLLLFFSAFTLLEATLPSLISKISPIRNKGTAMGIYSTCQFLGIFIGGSLGGLIFEHYHIEGLFIFCASLGLMWFISAITMSQPPYLSTLIYRLLDKNNKEMNERLKTLAGIKEVALMPEEGLIYLKVDKKIINMDELRNLIEGDNLGAVNVNNG